MANSFVPVDSAGLQTGFSYPTVSFHLDSAMVTAYLAAVGNEDFPFACVIPPLAVAARALTELSLMSIPVPGTVHVCQELHFMKTAGPEDSFRLWQGIDKRQDRRDMHILTTGLQVLDDDNTEVISGKITVMWQGNQA